MQGLSDLRDQASAPDPELSVVLDRILRLSSKPQGTRTGAEGAGARPGRDRRAAGRRLRRSQPPHRPTSKGRSTPWTGWKRRSTRPRRSTPIRYGPELQDRLPRRPASSGPASALVRRTRECVARIKEAAAVKPASLAVRKVMAQVKEEKNRLPDIDQNPRSGRDRQAGVREPHQGRHLQTG